MNLHTLQFFNPYRDIRHTKNRLPHWQQSGAVYFVTFRLADAISKHLREELEQQRRIWLRYHPEPWTAEVEREYHQRFTGAIERWLDVGYGSCLLRRPACARIVAETLQHFDGQRYSQIAWVVMPNHVHALFSLYEDCLLEKVLHTWKSFTANRINRVVARSGDSLPPGAAGSRPSFWQRDYFDRLVRDEKHLANCIRYIRHNPDRARLGSRQYLLFESDLARSIE